jgi:peptidoglycan hydrolase-like protein with peptidoglycan-binding domain
MESNVEVALAAKMLKLFPPTEESYLAFPVAGAGFTLDELAIFERPGETAEDVRLRYHHKAQFARLVNQIPADTLRWAPGDEYVWTEYKRVLDDAEMAVTTLTAGEQSSLEQARAYLADTVSTEGGSTTVYSPAVLAYYQYRDLADRAERAYLDEKLTAEMSQDPAVTQAWENGRRLELEAVRDRTMQDWAVLGHQAEVESAQATVTALGAKDPQLKRRALLSDYDQCTEPDLTSNDPVGVESTFYSPSDVFSPTSTWNTLHLSADEVVGLLADVPPELAPSTSTTASTIVSMSVEYASVTVMRPWFDPSFLAMRSWRLPDGWVVSDGAVPRSGRLTGYVTDLIVARKVTVERCVPAGQPSEPAGGSPVLTDLVYLSSAFLRVDQKWRVRAAEGPVRNMVVAAREVSTAPSAAELKRVAPDVAVLRSDFLTAKAEGTTVTELPEAAMVLPARRLAFERSELARPDLLVLDPPPSPAPPSTQVTDEVTLDGVVVLAYRVRRTPASPDPDPALSWEAPSGSEPVEPPPASPRHFPLPPQHVFGARPAAKVHNGGASAADRVGVLAIEAELHTRGAPVKVDGILGLQTEGAVKKFQREHGLTVDGLVGPKTWKALFT